VGWGERVVGVAGRRDRKDRNFIEGAGKHDVGIWSSLRPRDCLITSPVSHSSYPEAPH
jgi:hypothetical protein